MCKKCKLVVCFLVLCALFAASFSVGAVTADDPFQIVDAERVDGRTMIIRFNKKAVLDASKLFSWFGSDLGVSEDTGYTCINMWYGTSDNTLVENDTALKMTFDEGVVDQFFDEREGKDGKFYIVFHQDYNGALSSEDFESLDYDPVDLYQGDNFVGILGFSMYIPLSDFEGTKWKYRVDVETGIETTAPTTTKTPDISTDNNTSKEEAPKASETTDTVTDTNKGSASEKPFPIWIPIVAVVIVAAVVAVVIVTKKNKKK